MHIIQCHKAFKDGLRTSTLKTADNIELSLKGMNFYETRVVWLSHSAYTDKKITCIMELSWFST